MVLAAIRTGMEPSKVLNVNVFRPDALLLHYLKRAEDLLGTLAHGEAFENGVAGHSDDASLGLLRIRMAGISTKASSEFLFIAKATVSN